MDDRAVLCTLARQHSGDCAHTETPARHACRKVIRYKDAPLDVAAKAMDAVDRDLAHHVGDGEPFDPVAHAEAMAEAEEAGKVGPGPCPQCGEPLLSEPNGVHCDQCGWEPASPPTPPARTCSPDCACRTSHAARGCAGCHPDRYHDGEGFVPCAAHFANPPPVRPAPEPSTQDLIRAVLGAYGDVDLSRADLDAAEKRANRAGVALQERLSILAKHVGNGRLVLVRGATFKAIAPRKPRGGELAADALWRLEPVEVAK